MFTALFDAAELTVQIERMAEQLGIAMPKIVKFEAMMLLKLVVKFTHPKNQGQGRNAVVRDVTRAMTPLDPAKFRNEKMADTIRSGDIAAMNVVMQHVPGWKSWEVVAFDPDALHARQRDARGRIQRFKKKFVLGKTKWKQYVSRRQKNVGSAKASWAFAYSLVGGSLPGWIMAHVGEANRYSTTIDMLNDKEHPRLKVISSAKGVVGDEEIKRQISRAVETRVISMRAKTKRMLSDPLKYANLFAQYQ